ncbi:MAG: rhomboid family intramembrane serine protease [Proteobacteria bacterium]|nr:rhomboid family intramembrane serine protease [Pseudomonadota bacterium]
MLPLRDDNPTVHPPILTVGLIVVCVAVFLLQIAAGQSGDNEIIYRFGLIPAVFLGHASLPYGFSQFPPILTLFTSMFLHGGWLHLGGNMLFLWIFGNNVEDVLGHVKFLIFYILSGVGAGVAQMLVDTQSQIPMVGASGAIAGILAAYMVMFPRAKVLTLVWLGFFVTTVRIAAIWFLGIWLGLQWINALSTPAGGAGVAWWAHLGGFGAGLILLVFLKPTKYLFGPRRRGPW